MRHRWIVCVAAALIAGSAWAGAAVAKPKPKPKPPTVPPKLSISLDGTWQELLEAARALVEATKDKEEKAKEEPKFPIVLNGAIATGTVSDTVARLSVALSFEALSEKPHDLRFLPPGVSVALLKFDRPADGKAQVVRAAEGYFIRTTAVGTHALTLEYAARVEKKDKTHTVTLPLIAAAHSRTELTIPEASIEVKATPAVSLHTEAKGQGTLVTLFGAPAEEVTLTWSPKVERKDVKPVVFADQNARVTVGRGVLRVDSTIAYSILQGKVKDLSVGLPKDATLLSVKGTGVRSWDVADEAGGSTLKVQLLDEAGDRTQLELQVEQAIGRAGLGQAAEFAVPAITVRDVARETGSVGILVWKGLKVEPVTTQGVTQVDVREMAPGPKKGAEPVHLAYRYLQRPFEIQAKVSEVEAKVSADVLTTLRVSPEALRCASKITYEIKDAGIFRFRIKLGTDVKLVDLQGQNINNWEREADTLVIDLRSKAEGAYPLTLETEQPIPQGQSEVAVAPIELLDVARERGYLALAAYPGIKIEPVGPQNIMQVDVTDLPKETGQKADLAFRYLKHPYKLSLAISKVEAEVSAAVYTVLKVDEKRLEATAILNYDIRKSGIFQLQITLPKDFRLLGCEGENIDDWRATDGVLLVSLKQKTTGKYTLQLTGQQDVADLAAVPMPVVKAEGAEKETGFIVVRADESLRVKTGKTEGLAEIDVKEAQTELPPPLQKELQKGNVLLAYKYFAQPWTGVLAGEPIEPYVTADTFTFLSLGEALVQAAVTVRYDILYAGIQTFRIQLPEDVTNVDFKGSEIKHREEDKATHTWTVSLQAKKKTRYDLYVTFEQKVAGEQIDLAYAGVQVLDVKRETGYLAVAARSDLELAAGDKLEGLTPIDTQEIPADYRTGITVPLLLAFRYLKHPYTLHATATKHDPADVLVAIVEACFLSTTITEDGNLITDVACRVRNTREQNLAIALPEGAELWHAFVNGRRAIPVRSQEADKVWTKVPIAGVGDALRPFTVHLRYGRKIEALSGLGTLSLEFPQIALPAMRLGWQISLPERYRLISHRGTLRHTDYLDSELSGMMGAGVPMGGAAQPQPAQQQAFAPNYNKQVQDQLQQLAGSVKSGRAGGQRSIYTGSKPQTANVYSFQSLIAMKDTGTIRSTYLRSSVDSVVQGVLVVIAAVAVLAFFALCRGRSRLWRLSVVIALVLFLLGVRTLCEESYRQHLTHILWALACAGVVAAIWDKAKELRARQRRAQPPPVPDMVIMNDAPTEGEGPQEGEEDEEEQGED